MSKKGIVGIAVAGVVVTSLASHFSYEAGHEKGQKQMNACLFERNLLIQIADSVNQQRLENPDSLAAQTNINEYLEAEIQQAKDACNGLGWDLRGGAQVVFDEIHLD